jgi:hypothetical protein
LIMSVLIDILGSLMIATLLLLMMITFQMQLQETADRTIFAAQMMTHVQKACKELNNIIGLASVNIPFEDVAVITAHRDSMRFLTYWDYKNNLMTNTVNTISITLAPEDSLSDFGRDFGIIQIVQTPSPVYDLGSILWLEDLRFEYFDINGNSLGETVTGDTRKNIFSVDIKMTFKRDPPMIQSTPLRVRVQLRSHLMNRYLRYEP